jgi:hypothetical protein
MNPFIIMVAEDGESITTIYSDDIDFDDIGKATIKRASHIEPHPDGGWTADMSPVGGPTYGPFPRRSDALAAELAWLGVWLAKGCKEFPDMTTFVEPNDQ